MKRLLSSAFLKLGLTLGAAADPLAVAALIRRLHPVTTALPLVRLGEHGDGGYLVPDDLAGVAGCFSPGVGHTSSFDAAMLARGIPCFLADPLPLPASDVAPRVHYQQLAIDARDAAGRSTLDTWVGRQAPGDGDLILQMDIEGAEWAVLLNVSEATLRRFRLIVVELHDLDRLADRVGLRLFGAAIERLLALFYVVHLHPNNWGGVVRGRGLVLPRVMEVTLLRRDRAAATGFARRFPHPLDVPNCGQRPELVLPRTWFQSTDG